MERLKQIFTERLRTTGGLPTCSYEKCNKTTFNGKLYCSKHVCETKYAQKIAKSMEKRKKEVDLLNKRLIIPKDAHLVQEAMAVLWEERKITAPGLCRILGLTHPQARHLLRQVAKHGLAEIYQNKRKKLCAKAIRPQEEGLC